MPTLVEPPQTRPLPPQVQEEYVEEEQEQRPPQPMFSRAPPMPDNPDNDFFRFRIDGSDILQEVRYQLMGMVKNEMTGEWEKMYEPMINDDGLNSITHVMYSCGINKNVFLGNLTAEQINFKCKAVKRKLSLLIFKKYHEFEVQKEMRSTLIQTVTNTVHLGLSRCEGGMESRRLSEATIRHEMYSEQKQDSKPKLPLPSFLRRN